MLGVISSVSIKCEVVGAGDQRGEGGGSIWKRVANGGLLLPVYKASYH